MKKDIFYSICCLAFAIVIGGAVYEHMTIVPTWAAAPPVSLTMFQGEYGLKPGTFWQIIHPVNIFLLISTLVLHWRTARRINILILLAGYIVILAITFVYFVPELIDITSTAVSSVSQPQLIHRAKVWETLSLVRLGVLVILCIEFFLGLTKPNLRLARG